MSKRRRAATVSAVEQAHEALMRYLSDGRHHGIAKLEQRLRKDGYTQRIGYIQSKARKRGNVVVAGIKPRTCSSRPTFNETLRDLRRRRKTSYAYLRNGAAVSKYAASNWRYLSAGKNRAAREELKAEIDYFNKMIPAVARVSQRMGLD